MAYQHYQEHPRVQIPIRIDHSLHQRFTSISHRTKIPMSTLARDALERHISDIDSRGIPVVLKEMCKEVYQ